MAVAAGSADYTENKNSSVGRRLMSARKKFAAEREWLRHLRDCQGDKKRVRHMLHLASTKRLRIVALLVHLSASGDITLSRSNFDRLAASRKLNFIHRTFERERDLRQLTADG